MKGYPNRVQVYHLLSSQCFETYMVVDKFNFYFKNSHKIYSESFGCLLAPLLVIQLILQVLIQILAFSFLVLQMKVNLKRRLCKVVTGGFCYSVELSDQYI